jgi:putative hemolysin
MDGSELASLAATIDFHMPQFNAESWLQLTILVVALILCAIASAAETALTSVSRIRLKNMVEDGDQRAKQIEQLLNEPNTFLSTILVVNSVAVIVASSMATVLALHFSETWGELLSTVLSSVIVLIFCEITPKTAAVQNPLRWARALIGPVRGAAWVLRPIVWTLSVVTTFLVRMVGGPVRRKGPFVTEEELRMLVTVGEEEGILEEEETEMIHSIFEFADTTAREVMVPRIDMVTLPSDMTVNQAVDLALQGGFSRIPVYEADIGVDEIIGVLYTKDLLKQLHEGHHDFPVRELVRSAYYVPETKKLDDLLREIRQNRVHMVIVVDEYGSVAGLVTIEDLVEEIVGDIKDEYDREENLYEKVNDHEYIFDAKIGIYDFNDIMDTHLGDADYDTLGGFVYSQLDKIPSAGDVVMHDHLKFTVLATRGRRITQIRVENVADADSEEAEQNDQAEPLLLPAPSQEKLAEVQHNENGNQPPHYEYRGA